MKATSQSNSKGFTLIEVMIALLILIFGILGMSKLQGILIKNTSDADQRTVAVALAQKKIDDLRSYAELDLTGSSDWSCPPDVAINLIAASLAFADISDKKGGAPLCDTALLADTDILIGNTNYQLSWDVTPYEFVDNVPDALADTLSASPDVDFKNVKITVSWLDLATGNEASVALSTILDAYDPALTVLSDATTDNSTPIYTTYVPELAPDVIDVDVDTGDGTKRQTSKPLPDAVSQGQNINTLVTFDVITYQQNPINAVEFSLVRQEEYSMIDCKCTLSGIDGFAYPPAHVVWDDSIQDRYDYVGEPILKQTATQTNNVGVVDEICTTCCRDHHDDDASPVKYVAGTTNGNHTHYKANGTPAVAGEEYVESCRLKLVDGVYRVFQDWKLYDITTMDRQALASMAADGGIQDTYRDFVTQYVLNQSGVSFPVASKPDQVTNVSTSVGATRQLQARGIYIDEVYDLEGNKNPQGYVNYITADSPVNTNRLEKIPFSEVNLTLLSNWSSEDATKVTVTDEDVATISDPVNDYYGSYSRGFIQALAETAGVNITSSMASNNNGFTQLDDPSNSPIDDPVTVVVGSEQASIVNVSGSISGTTLPAGTKFTMETPQCSDIASNGAFTCTYNSGDDVNIFVSAYKRNSICDPAGGGSFSQSNVTSDINDIVITVTCP